MTGRGKVRASALALTLTRVMTWLELIPTIPQLRLEDLRAPSRPAGRVAETAFADRLASSLLDVANAHGVCAKTDQRGVSNGFVVPD